MSSQTGILDANLTNPVLDRARLWAEKGNSERAGARLKITSIS